MGTNFFLILPTEHSFDELHIGKRSGAGGGLCSFGLQGHRVGLDGPIITWAQWRRIILSVSRIPGGTVADEYSEEHDPADFIAEVENTTPENRRRQYDWMRDNGLPVLAEGTLPDLRSRADEQGSLLRAGTHNVYFDRDPDWLCPDGFSFTFSEFS